MLPVKKMILHQPPLEEISEVLREGLSKNFTFAQVNVVECPDLSLDPFDLADKGLCGQPRIVDLGGPDYLKPFPQRKKNYNFKTVAELSDLPNCLMVGAGAGPNHLVGRNCELICNVKVGDAAVNKTRIAKINELVRINQCKINTAEI